jgi:hypothetical protein
MTTQYEWEGRTYFPNDTVHRVKPGKGNILVPKSNPSSGGSGGSNTSGGGSGGGNTGGSGGGSPTLGFQVNPVNPSAPITPPVITSPPSTGGGSTNPPPQTRTPYPMIGPNGQPIFGTYQVFTVAHNGQNVNVTVPQGYFLLQTATGWQITNGTNVIWST